MKEFLKIFAKTLKWAVVTTSDMKFRGLLILMGQTKKNILEGLMISGPFG